MATTAALGGGLMAASHGVRRLTGPNSPLADVFDVAANFIPIGAGHRVARGAQAANDAAHEVQGARSLRQITTMAAPRE